MQDQNKERKVRDNAFSIGQPVVFNSTASDGVRGVKATVLRPLTEQEADLDDVGPMFVIRLEDGSEQHAFADELLAQESRKLGESGITVFVLPAQEDIAAFQNGRKPTNLLVRQFANEAELSAYKEGLGCIEDEFDEVDGLNVVGCKVTFTRATDEKDAADVTELVFATTGEAQACYEGVGDAEGMHAPFVVGPDEEGYELLAAFEAGKEAEPTAQLGLDISMSAQERDALLAALKLLEGALKRRLVIPNDGNIGDLLTNGGEHEGLTPQKIADLADRIVNAYPAPQVAPATEHQANKPASGTFKPRM